MPRTRFGAVPRGASSRRVVVSLLIVALLAVDVVLVAVAATAMGVKPHGVLAPIPTFSSGLLRTPTPTPSPAPPTTEAGRAPATTELRFLVVANASTAWRATAGSCSGAPAVVERTTDGGATWVPSDLSRVSAHTILYLSGTATSATIVSGATSSCTPTFFGSFTSGRFWAPFPDRMGEASYVDVASKTLHIAGAAVPEPCPDPRQVLSATTGTAVVCTGELEARTGSGSWIAIPIPGLLAAAASPTGFSVAVSDRRACAGVAIKAIDGSLHAGMPVTSVGCAAAAVPVDVALAQSGPSVWLWSGDKTLISSDSGANW